MCCQHVFLSFLCIFVLNVAGCFSVQIFTQVILNLIKFKVAKAFYFRNNLNKSSECNSDTQHTSKECLRVCSAYICPLHS